MFHVYKAYHGDAYALEDVTFRVERGEYVLLTGPSGAGKTTLLKLLFAGERASRGQILVDGRNIVRLRDSSIPYLRRNMGVVFQDFKLLPHRTVYENVAYPLEVLWMDRKEIDRRVRRVLRLLGLLHRMGALPVRLSGGEQQRVAIARAVVHDPPLLLADEPTGNLDPELTLEMMRLFREIHARGTTLIVATHDPRLVEHGGGRVLRLEAGRLVGA